MSKVEEKKKNKQEALLASAFKLFTEKESIIRLFQR